MTTKPDTNDLRSCGCKTEMCEHYKNYKHVSRIYCEDCGEIRTEKKTIKAYCFKHLKKHTTKPEWEAEFDNKHGRFGDFSGHCVRGMIDKQEVKKFVRELLASRLTGTVKVEELREKVKEILEDTYPSDNGEVGLYKVLALLDELTKK